MHFIQWFRGRTLKGMVLLTVSAPLLSLVTLSAPFARCGYSAEYQPLELIVKDAVLVPGEPLACAVKLNGPEAHLTIYSAPLGAVAFSGIIHSGETIRVPTAATIHATDVVVYAVTDGLTTAASVPVAVDANDTGPGGNGG